MLAPAVFGIHNNGINLAIMLVILFLVVIWLALIYWTYADARRRIADPVVVVCAAIASCFPYVGTIVYMIVRPPEFLDDVRERELEMQAAEARLAELGYHLCPHCDHEVEKDFLRCPNCMRKLKDPCHNCGRPLDPAWKVCPYCEAEIGGMPSPTRRTRRRREAPAEPPMPGPAGITAERTAPSGLAAERATPSALTADRTPPSGRADRTPPSSALGGGGGGALGGSRAAPFDRGGPASP
jgi:hypothetical protein